MRIFFALEIPDATKAAIARWRGLALPALGRPIQPDNFHITLNFLGEVAPVTLDNIVLAADRIRLPHFDIVLDQAGYFAKAGVYWIAPSSAPRALYELAQSFRKLSNRIGVKTCSRAYQPHLTLFRKCVSRPPLPTVPADFTLHCTGYTLFESTTGAKGVRYDAIHRWE